MPRVGDDGPASTGQHKAAQSFYLSERGHGDSVAAILTAPQPIIVIEIRITLRAATACPMTWRTIIGKGHTSLRAREVEQLRIGDNVGN